MEAKAGDCRMAGLRGVGRIFALYMYYETWDGATGVSHY